jgi:hypothetical protein
LALMQRNGCDIYTTLSRLLRSKQWQLAVPGVLE